MELEINDIHSMNGVDILSTPLNQFYFLILQLYLCQLKKLPL